LEIYLHLLPYSTHSNPNPPPTRIIPVSHTLDFTNKNIHFSSTKNLPNPQYYPERVLSLLVLSFNCETKVSTINTVPKRPRLPVRRTFLTACIIPSLQMSSKRTQRAPMDPGTVKHHPFSYLPPRRLHPRRPPHSPSPSPFRKSCPTRPSPFPHPHSRPHPSPL